MTLLITSVIRALKSLVIPGMFSVMIYSVIITLLALLGFIGAVSSLFVWIGDYYSGTAIAPYMGWIGAVGSSLLAWFLFPGIMPVVVSFFDNRIAGLIERHDYPAAALAREGDFLRELLHDAKFSFIVIGLNLLVLPLYLVPVINLFLFYLLNGYLLGREFFTMVARRHIPISEADILRKKHSRTITCAGALLAVGATIPLINLFAPFWGIAMMAHLYHRLAGSPELLVESIDK